MRGSSVHFKRIASALHAVSHASRDVSPEYLLPADVSMGTHVVIDDHGQVQKSLDQKMHLASRQAKATKDYSPLWEGVINLPEPAPDVTPEHQIQIVRQWCKEYEAMTGHKVLRADVHLDEGYIGADGQPHFNAHAHVMCDRTDDKGKVKKLTSTVLREVQNMTAEVTTLQRGIDARKTGRKHIGHQNFRFDAEKNRLDVEKPKADLARLQDLSKKWSDADLEKVKRLQAQLDGEVSRLAAALAAQKIHLDEKYRLEREALETKYKADRQAYKDSTEKKTQQDYKDLKAVHLGELDALAKAHESNLAGLESKLATAQSKADLVPDLKAEAVKAQAEIDRLTPVAAQVPELVAQVNTLKPKADRVQGLEQDLAKAQTEADKVAALVAQVNTLKPKADRVQGLEQDLAKAQTEADKVPALVAQVKTAQEQVQKTTEKLNVLTQKYEAFKEKAQGVVGEQNQKIAELIGELEEAKKPVLHQEAPVPEKTPREVFLALYGHLKTVLVGLIDGMRLDAVEGRLGLFSSHSRSGPRVQVLCDVPENKVMPKIGEVFDSRAIPGKGKGGIGD